MVDSKVETISRVARWKVDTHGGCCLKKSEPFKVGLWNWYLSVERTRYLYYIRLFPELSQISKEQPPIAKFILRVSIAGSPKFHISPVYERLLRTGGDFVWQVDTTYTSRLNIDVEFLDLKICPLNGGEARSVWPLDGKSQSIASQSALLCLSCMLNEAIHADLTINTPDGTLRAHKAVLSASSPVFRDDLKEKESSTIYIEDMSLESCMAFISYLYGTMKREDFWKHRIELLRAAYKYDIGGLKDECEESLIEDLNSGNVLERLNEAWIYQLHKLKKECFKFLFNFGKIYDVRDEVNNFFRLADRELMLEMFQEVFTIWKLV